MSQQALALCSGDNGLSIVLKELHNSIAEIARLDPSAESIARDFDRSVDALAECEIALSRYVNSLDVDASLLESLREELSLLARLERKYRQDDAGLLTLLESAQAELYQFDHQKGIRDASQLVEELTTEAHRIGSFLRKERQDAAKTLSASVHKELAELAMPDASLTVCFTPVEPTSSGLDRIEFTIATNKGEPQGPLAKMASGGELSRVMLVLKKILREQSGVNVLIFDEVDTGISGGIARSVGRMLKSISGQSQVLCITHLPQVASLSDRHFLVQKEVGDRALTVVRALSEVEKVDEIARMLAGFTITDASRASARELIESA